MHVWNAWLPDRPSAILGFVTVMPWGSGGGPIHASEHSQNTRVTRHLAANAAACVSLRDLSPLSRGRIATRAAFVSSRSRLGDISRRVPEPLERSSWALHPPEHVVGPTQQLGPGRATALPPPLQSSTRRSASGEQRCGVLSAATSNQAAAVEPPCSSAAAISGAVARRGVTLPCKMTTSSRCHRPSTTSLRAAYSFRRSPRRPRRMPRMPRTARRCSICGAPKPSR